MCIIEFICYINSFLHCRQGISTLDEYVAQIWIPIEQFYIYKALHIKTSRFIDGLYSEILSNYNRAFQYLDDDYQ